MSLLASIRWRTASPGFHALRTGVLALVGAILLARISILVEKIIWPAGEPLGAGYVLDRPILVLIFFLVLVGIVSIPVGMVVLIKERLRRGG